MSSPVSEIDPISQISIIVPCFNEEKTIVEILSQILAQTCVGEVLVFDDGSTDGTRLKLEKISDSRVSIYFNDKNRGKGFCVRQGIQIARFPIVGIQDADLEYSPDHYEDLIDPIILGKADVVYGTRFHIRGATRLIYFWHYVANRFLTNFCNIFTNLNMSDMETGQKFFRRECLDGLILREQRFGIEPEITIKTASRGLRFYEVPISYSGRSYIEGKKIRFKDGLKAIWCIWWYGTSSLITKKNES